VAGSKRAFPFKRESIHALVQERPQGDFEMSLFLSISPQASEEISTGRTMGIPSYSLSGRRCRLSPENDDVSFAGNGTSKDVIVGRIVFDDVGNDFRCNYICHAREAFCSSFDCVLRPHEFLPKDVGEFGNDCRRYENDVCPSECMIPNGSKLSLGTGEDRNIDILSRTTLNFSCCFSVVMDKSVRVPRFNTLRAFSA
jgi:hypothetical protein